MQSMRNERTVVTSRLDEILSRAGAIYPVGQFLQMYHDIYMSKNKHIVFLWIFWSWGGQKIYIKTRRVFVLLM